MQGSGDGGLCVTAHPELQVPQGRARSQHMKVFSRLLQRLNSGSCRLTREIPAGGRTKTSTEMVPLYATSTVTVAPVAIKVDFIFTPHTSDDDDDDDDATTRFIPIAFDCLHPGSAGPIFGIFLGLVFI